MMSAAPDPIKTAELSFDDVGYPGWRAIVRTNLRRSVYDDLYAVEPDRWWRAFGQTVVSWNFPDADGNPMPLPREIESVEKLDLHIDLISLFLQKYPEAVRTAMALPKASSEASEPTSSTSEGSTD
jgi:hypothetical protein